MKEVASHTPRSFPVETICANCGETWGVHDLLDCPNNKTEFEPKVATTSLDSLQSAVNKACGEIGTLRASNRELLAALEALVANHDYRRKPLPEGSIDAGDELFRQAEAAIQKAKP